MNAVVQTLQDAVGRDRNTANVLLNPEFRYLRVTIEGRVAFLALGYVDSHPQGPIEVWYSAFREVLRLQNGRIVGAVGLTTEWRSVLLPELPSWSALARAGEPVRWTRARDVMPGYRFGLKDALTLRVVPVPKTSALQGLDPQSLTWFEERVEAERLARPSALPDSLAADLQLPPARYALDIREGREIAVYGEQCLAPNLCFTWQRWPAEPQGSSGK
jgi:hypothetical protein